MATAESAPMNGGSSNLRERDERDGTLGGLLYADRSKQRIPEGDWVALVRAIAARDQTALRALYQRAHALVFTLSLRISQSRETAEELTVDVFHDIWRRAPEYDPANGTVLGWVMNQARSRAIDRLRFDTRKKRTAVDADGSGIVADDAEDRMVAADHARVLQLALASLTAGERAAIEVAYFADLTHTETAAQLGVPLGTIKTRIRAGLAKLRKALSNGGGRS